MENNGRADRDAGTAVRQGLREAQGQIQDRLEDLRGYADSLDGWVRSFAREKPLLAIACAAGIGFLVGRIASKA